MPNELIYIRYPILLACMADGEMVGIEELECTFGLLTSVSKLDHPCMNNQRTSLKQV